MEEQLNNIVEKIYKLRKNFVIIGLTGRLVVDVPQWLKFYKRRIQKI